MLSHSKVVAFAATSKPDEAKFFYSNTLGLKLLSADAYAMVFDARDVMLRVQIVEGHSPPPYTVLGWDVTDIESDVQKLLDKGVKFEHYELLGQNDSGVWLSPSGAHIAWFKDPDGNTLSLTQF